MFFKKKKTSTTKKIDKLVTWLIIWWAVAWMVGLSQTEKWKKITKDIKEKSGWKLKSFKKVIWKTSIKILDLFDKFKK